MQANGRRKRNSATYWACLLNHLRSLFGQHSARSSIQNWDSLGIGQQEFGSTGGWVQGRRHVKQDWRISQACLRVDSLRQEAFGLRRAFGGLPCVYLWDWELPLFICNSKLCNDWHASPQLIWQWHSAPVSFVKKIIRWMQPLCVACVACLQDIFFYLAVCIHNNMCINLYELQHGNSMRLPFQQTKNWRLIWRVKQVRCVIN